MHSPETFSAFVHDWQIAKRIPRFRVAVQLAFQQIEKLCSKLMIHGVLGIDLKASFVSVSRFVLPTYDFVAVGNVTDVVNSLPDDTQEAFPSFC